MRVAILAYVFCLASVAFLPGVAFSHSGHPGGTPIGSTLAFPGESLVNVSIQGFAFHAPDITIDVGATVLWTNLDDSEHTATSQTGPGTLVGSGVFGSGLLSINQSYQFTFTDIGEFHYYCLPHGSSMQGVVRVTAVPEPSAMLLMIGFGMMTFHRLRRNA